jgi:hypothetical protein
LDESYEVRFGPCKNKLRLILDLLAVSYRLSNVFVSDGSLQERLKREVLAKAGERRTREICTQRGFEGPFLLGGVDGEVGKGAGILSVIREFTEVLVEQSKTFEEVWDSFFNNFGSSSSSG